MRKDSPLFNAQVLTCSRGLGGHFEKTAFSGGLSLLI